MYNSNSRKNKRIFFLFLITITTSFFTFSQLNWNFNESSSNPNSPTGFELFNKLKISDYSSNFVSTGENMNITLHQSYLNTSFDIILNTSIVNGNNFTIPSPTDTTFNSSYTRFEMKDIIAPNKTLIVEDDLGVEVINPVSYHYISFEVIGTGYLENISLYLRETNAADTTRLNIYLYNSTNDAGNIRPDTSIATVVSSIEITSDTFYWHKFTAIHSLVNSSKTYMKTFFLNLEKSGPGSTEIAINGTFDTALGDNKDESIVLDSGENLHKAAGFDVDAALIVDLMPLNNTPRPEQVNLEINNKQVSRNNDIDNTGYWISSEINSSASGLLKYNLTADWWNVESNITQVLINYTRTDLRASSTFQISESGQNVEWNVTRNGGLSYFDSDFSNYRINFTIPKTWEESSIKVFNGSNQFTVNKRLRGNGYRDVEVPNAGNGIYWFLNATSDNLLNSIEAYINAIPISVFNYTNIVYFNATFSNNINDGLINLSIFNPVAIDNKLNYTFTNNSFSAGSEVYFGKWNISETITKYGIFRLQVGWNNNTDAGFYESTLKVVADTELTIIRPPQNVIFNASRIFNMTIIYNDTGQNKNITDADIQYKINDGAYSTINENVTYIGYSKYNITFDCNNTFNYGLNNITIKANGTYYSSQTETLNITIWGETSATFDKNPIKSVYDSGSALNISVYFEDIIKNTGISGADLYIFVNNRGNPYSTTIHDYGNGYYNITIDFTDAIFNGYGPFNLIVDVNSTNYYNQTSAPISIDIRGETSATFDKDPPKSVYDSGSALNISVYFEDTIKSTGISGADLYIFVNNRGNPYSTTIHDYGNGYYNITIDFTDAIFNGYGPFNLIVDVNKTYYYNQTSAPISINIRGETTSIFTKNPDRISFNSNEILTVNVQYYDSFKGGEWLSAEVTAWVNNYNYTANASIAWDATYYYIEFNFSHWEFRGYGGFTIKVELNKTYYYNATQSYNIYVGGPTSATFNKNPPKLIYDSGETLNISVYYEDTTLVSGIPGANLYIFVNNMSNPYSTTIYDYGDGNYNITIDFTDPIFNGYGSFDLIVVINKTNYQGHTSTPFIGIVIRGETTATFDKDPDQSIYYSGDTLNISVYYGDIIKSVGISGADLYIFVNSRSNPYSTTIYDYGDGNYNITIDFTDNIFNGYGSFNLFVDVNKTNYNNQTSAPISINMLGETTATIDKDPSKLDYDSGDTLNISVYYKDSIKNVGISGADIYIFVNNRSNLYSTTKYDYGDGNYNITIDFTDNIFNGYGLFDLVIDVNKTYYYNGTQSYNIRVLGLTSFNLIRPDNKTSYLDGETFNITVQFNDEAKSIPINGIINYSIDGSPYSTSYNIYSIGVGKYNITINVNNDNFTNYGYVDIIININKTNYYNKTIVIRLERQIRTSISPGNSNTLPDVYRGQTILFTFNYSDILGTPITIVNSSSISSDYGLSPTLENKGNGNYTMHLNTSIVNVGTYNYIFNISI
ncbi:hypothetical protein LCGC14_1242000, partial [marine sediment metagenome]